MSLTGATNSIANRGTFDNTGMSMLGNNASDTLTFTDALTATAPSSIAVYGQIRSLGAPMSLGDSNTAVTLTGSFTLDTTNNGASLTGANIVLGGTVDGPQVLELTAAAGDITCAGAVSHTEALTSITVNSANDLTFKSTIDTTGRITQSDGTDTTTFNGTNSGGDVGGSLSVNANEIPLNTAFVVTTGSVFLDARNTINVGMDAGLNAGASTILISAYQDSLGAQGFNQADSTTLHTLNSTASALSITVGGNGAAAITALQTGSGVRVTITSGAAIRETNGGVSNINVGATGSAVLMAVGGIGNANALETTLGSLAFSNATSGAPGNVDITNSGALPLASVGSLTNSWSAGGATITASSPITFAANLSTVDSATYTATENSLPGTDKITVIATVTVKVTGAGNLPELRSGDRIDIKSTAIVRATGAGGDVPLQSGFGDSDGDGAMTIDGTVSANDIVALNLNAQQIATQTATGTVSATDLLLLSMGNKVSFDFDTSTSNHVTTLAANTNGVISFRDYNGVTIGMVGSTNGITTVDDIVEINSDNGIIVLNRRITTAGTGTTGTAPLLGAVSVSAMINAASGSVILKGNASGSLDINSNFTSVNLISVAVAGDIFIGDKFETTGAHSDLNLTADNDGNGSCGVRIKTADKLLTLGSVTLAGSDLIANGGGVIDSIEINSDGSDTPIQTGDPILIQSSGNAAETADWLINGKILGTGAPSVTIRAKQDVLFGADCDVKHNIGNISVTANATSVPNIGAVTMDSGTTIDVGSGTIDITASDPVTLAGLSTTTGTTVAVSIASLNGAIVDAASATTDITASNAALTAAAGIGASGTLESAVSLIAVRHTARGTVNIANNRSGLLTVGRVGSVIGMNNSAADVVLVHSGPYGCASPLTIADNAISSGNIFIAVANSTAAGDNLVINAITTGDGTNPVRLTAGGTVTLRAGDDYTLPAFATIAASGSATIVSDFGDLDASPRSCDSLSGHGTGLQRVRPGNPHRTRYGRPLMVSWTRSPPTSQWSRQREIIRGSST